MERAAPNRLHRGVDRPVAGHHDHRQCGVAALRRCEQHHPVGVGHAQVGDQHVDRAGLDQRERVGAVADGSGIVAAVGQPIGERLRELELVVDDDHAASGLHGRAGGKDRASATCSHLDSY